MNIPQDPTEIAVIDELGNTVGMLVSSSPNYTTQQSTSTSLRCPVPCTKQTSITTQWLKENFVENVFTSVPRNIMFEEYINYCCDKNTKPFNQAVFGKVVRACFPNLATRRLGVRGQSRYHYAGLSVKASSIYAERLQCNAERFDLSRLNNGTQPRHRDVTAHMTVDQSKCKASNKPKYRCGISKLIMPPYPTEDDIWLQANWERDDIGSFLNLYRAYNSQMLECLITLHFENTLNHVCNFLNFFPSNKGRSLLRSSTICDVIAVCDDIMFQEANSALVPDCLATLTSEFSVTVRKLAKALPSWIANESNLGGIASKEVVQCRVQSAKQWSDHVRRVTTLCHVTKEARKTLTYPSIVVPLLNDLRFVPIENIAEQCSFAGNQSNTEQSAEGAHAQYYMKRFCDLLRDQVSVEYYAYELERLVEKHGGLRKDCAGEEGEDLVTDQTRSFIMKWAAYGSKILTEITLKSSESVGPFHLVMLLFGDYINHVITLKNEHVRRMRRLRSVIRSDSTYFTRVWNNPPGQGQMGSSSVNNPPMTSGSLPVTNQGILPPSFEPDVGSMSDDSSSLPSTSDVRSSVSKRTKLAAQVAGVVASLEKKPPVDLVYPRPFNNSPSFYVIPSPVTTHTCPF